MVPDALIPPEGRTVKCGRCTHQWFTEAPLAVQAEEPPVADFSAALAAATQEEPSPAVEESAIATPQQARQLPAPTVFAIPVLPFKIAAPLLAICWLVVAIYAYFPNGQYGMFSGLYGALGAADTRGVVFEEVNMEKQPAEDGGRTRFVLFGSLANHASETRAVPRVRVELRGGENEVLWSRTYPVDVVVKPGEVYPFRIEDVETSFSDRVVSVVMDVGNNFELVMR